MFDFKKYIVVSTLIIAAGGFTVGNAQQRPAVYTAEQASAGRAAYQANCASCHLPDLAGRNEAPQLSGSNFMTTWGGRTTRELVALIQTTMPPGNEGGLGEQTYIQIAAFILQANGAGAGNQPLVPAGTTVISSVANGQMPASLRQGSGQGAGQGAGRGGQGQGQGAPQGRGGVPALRGFRCCCVPIRRTG
jgi:hypothetical protein